MELTVFIPLEVALAYESVQVLLRTLEKGELLLESFILMFQIHELLFFQVSRLFVLYDLFVCSAAFSLELKHVCGLASHGW